MTALKGPLEGRHGSWSVGELVGTTSRWTTYRGTDEAGSPVAIRTPTGEISSDQYDRFDSLARQWSSVDERRTVRTLRDWGTDPEPWVAVEYVPEELAAWATGDTLAIATACDLRTRGELLSDICEVLRTYGRYGSTPAHLGIHPDCLSFRVDDDGPVAVVGDWGLSRLVEEPPVTPFTAPEQLDGDHASRRTDVYRIGVLAAAVLSGSRPFEEVSPDLANDEDAPADGVTDRDTTALAAAIREGFNVDTLADRLPDDAVRPIRRAADTDPETRQSTTYPLGRDLLDAVPSVDVDDREADALAATVAPSAPASSGETATEEKSGSDGDSTDGEDRDPSDGEDDDAMAGTDGSNPADDKGSNPADGGEPTAADDGSVGTGSTSPVDGTTDPASGSAGSRRSFLKYGVGTVGIGGIAYGAIQVFGDDLTGDGSGAVADPSSGASASDSDDDGEPSLEVTGGTVTIGARFGTDLETLPEAIEDVDIPAEIDVALDDRFNDPDRIDRYLAGVEGGDDVPDLLLVNTDELTRVVRAGATESLSRYADDHPIGDVLGESFPALERMSRNPEDGAVHALPYGFIPETVAYRKSAFREIDDESTFEAWMTDPPTWSEWSSIVAAFRRDQGFVWAGGRQSVPRPFSEVLAAFGGSYYETDGSRPADGDPVTVADADGVEAANVLHDLVLGGDRSGSGVERASAESVLEFDVIDPVYTFADENAIAARVPLSTYESFFSEAEREDIGMMPAPAGPAGSYTGVYASYVVVNPNTELLGEALSVAEAFRSPVVASLLVDQGLVPTLNGDPFSVDAVADAPYAEHRPAIEYVAENAVLEPSTATWSAERQDVGAVLRSAITDDPSVLAEIEAILEER